MLIGALASVSGEKDVLGFSAETWESAFLGALFSFHLNDIGMDERAFFLLNQDSPEKASLSGFLHGIAEPGDSGDWYVVSRESKALAVCHIPGENFTANGKTFDYPVQKSIKLEKWRKKFERMELKGREGCPGLKESVAFTFFDLPTVLEHFGIDVKKAQNVFLGFVAKGLFDDVGRMTNWRNSGGGIAEYQKIFDDARECLNVDPKTLALFNEREKMISRKSA